jgi:hypothetical protein
VKKELNSCQGQVETLKDAAQAAEALQNRVSQYKSERLMQSSACPDDAPSHHHRLHVLQYFLFFCAAADIRC